MRNALNRENVHSQYFTGDVIEYDLGTVNLDGYDFGEYSWAVIRDNEYCRPDLISLRLYGTSNLWWFICWYNGFQDPWHDLQPDTGVKYPSLEKAMEGIRWAKDRSQRFK